MSQFYLSARSLRRLEGVEGDLIRVVTLGLSYSPVDFAVSEGLRSVDRQRKLVARGASRTMQSKHLVGRAVDVIAVGDLDRDGDIDAQDRDLTWDEGLYGQIAQAVLGAAKDLGVKVRWGGDFKSFFDGPHFELL